MTDEESEWCSNLKEASRLSCEEDYDLYKQAAQRLSMSNDLEVLRTMFGCFSDVEAGEIQHALIDACETFPDEIYVRILISEGQTFARNSPWWFNHVIHVMLNTGTCLDVLYSCYTTLSVEKRRWLLSTVAKLAEEREKYAVIHRSLRAMEEGVRG